MQIASKAAAVVVVPNFADIVTLRVKKWQRKKSSAGNDQFVLDCEIVKPDDVEVEGVKYVLSGQELTFYLGLSDEIVGNAKKSPLRNTQDFHEKLGLPLDFDDDSPPYEGLLFEYYLQSQERLLQRRTKEGKYEPVLGTDSKPKKLGWEWSNFLGNVSGPSSLSIEEGF